MRAGRIIRGYIISLLRRATATGVRYAERLVAIAIPARQGCTRIVHAAETAKCNAKVPRQTGAVTKSRLVESVGGAFERRLLGYVGVGRGCYEALRKREDDESGIE